MKNGCSEIMKIHKGIKRLRAAIPKIGIRPTIDGRLNRVRESLLEYF